MKFKEFVKFLEKLEGTASRLEMTDVLVELLKKLMRMRLRQGVI